MKFLLLFFIAVVVVFQWRQARKPKVHTARQSAPAPEPTAMLSCAQCGLHFPQADAVRGISGVYCSTAHRQALEP